MPRSRSVGPQESREGSAGRLAAARGPRTEWGELVQTHDDRAIFQGRIDELPAIDTQSL